MQRRARRRPERKADHPHQQRRRKKAPLHPQPDCNRAAQEWTEQIAQQRCAAAQRHNAAAQEFRGLPIEQCVQRRQQAGNGNSSSSSKEDEYAVVWRKCLRSVQ